MFGLRRPLHWISSSQLHQRSCRCLSSAPTKRPSILLQYPHLRKEIQQIQQDVLGYAPPSLNNMRTGYQSSKKQLTGVYLNQYYDANPSIDPFARQVIPGWKNDQEERREQKLHLLRRRGKGPPKKGSGKKSKKKGK